MSASMCPKVICHIMSSVDGRLLPERWTLPFDGKDKDELLGVYAAIGRKLGADAWMFGKNTLTEGYFPRKFHAGDSASSELYEAYVAPRSSERLFVVADPDADILYESPTVRGDDIVAVLPEMVSEAYLEWLRRHGISYFPAGRDGGDLSLAMRTLAGVFDVKTGQRACNAPHSPEPPLFQDVFGETLLELARTNPRIVGITPAMPSGCSMCIMQREMPERVFDVGIAEGHAVTFSAGLAKEGLLPFCNIYSSFMQRAYDNIIHDVALQRLHVVLCIDRAGIVGADGATHQGEFDLAYLRPIPHLTIAAPRNEMELRNLMYTAQCTDTGPFAIRYPRGKGFNLDWRTPLEQLPVGKGEQLKEGGTLAVLTIGTMAHPAARAIAAIEAERPVSIAHYDMRYLKPLDEELLHQVAQHYNKVVTVEDGVIAGGFGSAVLEFMADHGYAVQVTRLGIPDTFVEHGSQAELYHLLGLDAEGIRHSIEAVING